MSLLIFPNQLFPLKMINQIDSLKFNKIFIIEEPRYFSDFKFHKLKLLYHRESMKKYYDEIIKKFNIIYIDFNNVNKDFYKKRTDILYKLNFNFKQNIYLNLFRPKNISYYLKLKLLLNKSEF